MKIPIPILFIFVISLFFAGCDKCDGVACSTGPPSFSVMLLDKETGENVFASGRYKENQVSVEDSEGNSVYSLVVGEDDYFVIRIALPSKKADITVNLNLDNSVSIPISVYVREGRTKCCTNYFAEDVTPSSHEYERDGNSGDLIIEI